MGSTYDLPNDVVNTFLCYICKGYLSCGPVKEENGNLVCGRCNSNDLNTGAQIAFEKILKNFSFPCKYDKEGCETRVLFNSSTQHETNCSYRTLCCPAKFCASTLRFSQFYYHFTKEHKKLILNNGSFKLTVADSSNFNFLMIKDDIVVVIKYCYDAHKKSLQLNIESLPIGDKLIEYKVQIINESDCSHSISLPKQQCSVYETSGIHQNIDLLDIAKYLPVFNNPLLLIVKIEIESTAVMNRVDISEYTGNFQTCRFPDDLEEEMVVKLQKLENYCCESCYNYPVTLSCNFCSTPSTTISTHYKDNRYDVRTRLPCLWRGCQFLGTKDTISEHIDSCNFKVRVCPYFSTCAIGTFKFYELSIEHLKTHGIHCPNPKKIQIKLFNENKAPSERSYFTTVKDEIVTFTIKIIKDNEWNLHTILPQGYELVFFLSHDHCRRSSKTLRKNDIVDVSLIDFRCPPCFKQSYRCMANMTLKAASNYRLKRPFYRSASVRTSFDWSEVDENIDRYC